MKNRRILTYSFLLIVIVLISLAIPLRPALAASVSVSPTSGNVDTLLYISGDGFNPGVSYRVYFAYHTAYELIRSGTVASDGTVSHSIRVPEIPGGSYIIRVETDVYYTSSTFSVLPSISLSKTSAILGDKVTIEGNGFRAGRNITITFNGSTIKTTSTNSKGSFYDTFIVPACYNRTPEVQASDGAFVASEELTILASITLSTNSGKVGDEIIVNGNGFRSNRLINLTIDGIKVDTDPESIYSNSKGCFETSFIIPVSSHDTHVVRAYDGTNDAKANYTTTASISLSPTSGRIGSEVTVTGNGFGSNKVVTIRFANEHVRTTAANSKGSFTTKFLVPQYSTGTYEVSASDSSVTDSTNFTLTVSVNINPDTGHVGTPINVSGNGFVGAITIRYDNTIVVTTTADNNGTFWVTFNAPESVHGHHIITVSGAISTVETTFTMESDAPAAPSLISPKDGDRKSSRPSFEWRPVDDPSGISYTLQVATDSSFNNLALERKGLVQSTYTPRADEALELIDWDSPYYWRVMAVDGASNDSEWSPVRSFYVWFLPQWAIYSLIIVVSVIISVLVARNVYRKR